MQERTSIDNRLATSSPATAAAASRDYDQIRRAIAFLSETWEKCDSAADLVVVAGSRRCSSGR